MEFIENRTLDEIAIGDSASLERRLTMQDIKLFAGMSGDVNPAHVDEDYAKSSRFQEIIAHGMWGGALISTVLGTQLPGPGAIYVSQTLSFHRPVGLGDVVTVGVTAKEKNPARKRILFDCCCLNQEGEVVISGVAEVIAPTEKVRRPRALLPGARLAERAHMHRLLSAAVPLEPVPTAVIHPVDKKGVFGSCRANGNVAQHSTQCFQ
jgi:phosphate acetyltransferase